MRNGSILAQCWARAWDGARARDWSSNKPGTVPSQSAANTLGGRGSGARGDGGERCAVIVETVGMWGMNLDQDGYMIRSLYIYSGFFYIIIFSCDTINCETTAFIHHFSY